jgi:Protein of unknown function (DUF3040)
MPIGAGGEALRRIEAVLAADDPALVESFRQWREPPGPDPDDPGTVWVGKWTALVLLVGLTALIIGPVGLVTLLVLGVPVWVCVRAQRAERRR